MTLQDVAMSTEADRPACDLVSQDETLGKPLDTAAAVALLVDALDKHDSDKRQALSTLTKLAFCSREHRAALLLHSGLIPKLINFLPREDDLSSQALLTLGNLALLGAAAAGPRRSALARLLTACVLPRMRASTSLCLLKTVVRTYSNFLSHDDDYTLVEIGLPALPYLRDLLDVEHHDSIDPDDKHSLLIACEIVVDACIALANITQGPDECTAAVQAVPGLTARLVTLMGHKEDRVKEAALSAVGNMLAGTYEQAYRCLSADCLEYIVPFLQSKNPSIVKEAARATGNIFAGKHHQIQRALEKNVLHPLQKILVDGDAECQKAAALAITSLCYNGTAMQRSCVASCDVLGSYCALLASSDRALAGAVLEGLHELTQPAEKDGVKSLFYMLDEFDVLYHMEQLQELTTDEDLCSKIEYLKATLRKHAREERVIVHDDDVFTAERIVRELGSQEVEVQIWAASAVFPALDQPYPPVNALMAAGLMTPLLEALDDNAYPDFQYVATWALTYITAGTCSRRITTAVENGVISKLLALLAPGNRISELAACSLGNISLHAPEVRAAILAYVESDTALAELRTYVRSYRKMCSQVCHVSKTNLVPALQALPFVSELLDIGDQDILVEACFAFASLGIEAAQAAAGLTARLVALMAHEAAHVKEAAFNAVAYLLTGSDTQILRCVDAGCLDHIVPLLQSPDPSLATAATAAAADVLRHTYSIKKAMERNILALLTNIISNGEPRCQKEAAHAITNVCRYGLPHQRARVRANTVLGPYCRLLAGPSHALIEEVLDGLTIMLDDAAANSKMKQFCIRLDIMGVLGRLQQLQEEDLDENVRLKAITVSFRVRQQVRNEHIVLVEGTIYRVEDIVQGLKCEDVSRQRGAARAALELVGVDDPHSRHAVAGQYRRGAITAAVTAGLLPLLVAALHLHTCFDVQQNAVATLRIISLYGTFVDRAAVINAGGIQKLISVVRGGGPVATQAAAALGNVARRGPAAQELVHSRGVMPALMLHMHDHSPGDLLTSCLWAYSRICNNLLSSTLYEGAVMALPSVLKLMYVDHPEVLEPACLAVASLMSTLHEEIALVQAVSGLTERLVALLAHESTQVKEAALNALSNMLTGDVFQVEHCLEAGCLPPIIGFLYSDNPKLLKAAAAAASNVLRQLSDLDLPGIEQELLPPLLNLLANAEPNSHLQYYVVCAIRHLAVNGTPDQKIAVVHEGGIPLLVSALSLEDPVVEQATEALGALTRECSEAAELALACGAVPAILPYLRANTPRDTLRNSLWACSSICRYVKEPKKATGQLLPVLPYLSDIVDCDDRALKDGGITIAAALAHTEEGLAAVCAAPGLTARIVAMLAHDYTAIKMNALSAVVKILSGPVTQMDICIEEGCLEYIKPMLQSSRTDMVELAADAVARILNTSHLHVQQALNKGLIPPILNVLFSAEYGWTAQIRAAHALSGIISVGTHEQIMTVAEVRLKDGSEIIPKIIELMGLGGSSATTACQLLTMLAVHHPELRHSALAHGAVLSLLPYLTPETPIINLKICIHTYKVFCSQDNYKQKEKVEFVSPALPKICELLNVDNEYVLGTSCWSLDNITQTTEGIDAAQAVPGLTARVVALLAHEGAGVKIKAMAFVMNIMTLGTEKQMEQCLEADCLKHIASFLQIKDGPLFKMALKATYEMFLKCSHSRIQQASECGVLSAILDILAEPTLCLLQYFVVGVLGYMFAYGTHEHRMATVHGGAIPKLVSLLSHEAEVAAKAAELLGILAQVFPEMTDEMLTHGAVEAMMPRFNDNPKEYVKAYRNMCWFSAKNPTEMLRLVTPALPLIAELMATRDEFVLEAACYAINAQMKTEEGITAVQAVEGLTARLVALLAHNAADVKSVAIANVLIMLSGTDLQVGQCLEADCVEHMTSYLRSRDAAMMKAADVATRAELGPRGTALFLRDGDITPLMATLAYDQGHISRKTGMHAISNLCRLATSEQRGQLVSCGVLGPYRAVLAGTDHELITFVLDSLEKLLQASVNDDSVKPLCAILTEMGILDQMTRLREHGDEEITTKVNHLIHTYFSGNL